MAQEETLVPADIRYPVIQYDETVIPGDVIDLRVDSPEDFIAALKASDNKVFIAGSSSTPQEGEVGTIGFVRQKNPLPNGQLRIIVESQARSRLLDINTSGAVDIAKAESFVAPASVDNEFNNLVQATLDKFKKSYERELQNPANLPLLEELSNTAKDEPYAFADRMALSLGMPLDQKQELLQALDPKAQLQQITAFLVDKDLDNSSREDMGQKEEAYILRQKREAIDKRLKEIGGDAGEEDELDVLEKKIANAGMTEEARTKCEKELKKLRKMSAQDPNANKTQEYLERMVSFPWKESSKLVEDLGLAREVLDADHYGLTGVKDRIIEQLAVQLNTGKVNGSIICLAGPPGVGKTSIGQSIARATGRKFVRLSLGGVSDETVIRGHGRTYLGSMPGKIMRAMQEAGTINPVMQLDEIDKMGSGANLKGDPTSALLEVLDPAQNSTFVDQYTDVKYDLSNVMFIASANELDNIPGPLLDRLEIIEIAGYTDEEKMQIAKDHLIKKEMEKSGLTNAQFSISDQALAKLIDGYTREAGVRGLEKQIAKLVRKTVVQIQQGKAESVAITPENLVKYAGRKKAERKQVDTTPRVGHVNGLAVTGASGAVLPLEAVMFADPKGGIDATGNLMETMSDSVKYADAYVKAHAAELGIPKEVYLNNTLHIKAGSGGIKKDGPSAGLAIATLITSIRTGIPIRGDVAMTGEISLLGESGIIGGLPQKLDGALKAGIKTVLIPEANVRDLEDVPERIKQALEIIPVKNITEVLQHALVRMPEPLAADESLAAKNSVPDLLQGLNGNQILSLLQAFTEAAQSKVPANDTTPPAPVPAAEPRRPAMSSKPRATP